MRKSHLESFKLDRRNVVVGAGAVAAAAAFPNALAAQETGLAPAADLLAGAQKFLAMLEPEKRKAASFAWNGPQWKDWDYFGSSDNIKPGLRLEQMSAAQKAAAWDLLAALLSPAGIEKARTVMLLQDILAAQGNAPRQRSSGRFSFALFGAPGATGAWGLRLEGHHLSLSAAVRDGRIVAVTPSSFSSNPNRVTGGQHAGLVTLKGEEALARRLFGDLAPKLQGRARRASEPLDNILSYAGRERTNARKTGLPASELASAQRDLLWELIETYAAVHLAPALATAQRERIRTGDREAVHFAWYGPNTPERAFGYRVIGDGFVIELGSVDPAALHLHTIYHDLRNVLGRA
jgi:hypothetical protein